MLQLNAQTKIFAGVMPVDFRKGVDSLGLVCKRILFDDPFSRCLLQWVKERLLIYSTWASL